MTFAPVYQFHVYLLLVNACVVQWSLNSVVLKFFVERTYFTKSLMSTKKQLNIIVNKKQRTLKFSIELRLVTG